MLECQWGSGHLLSRRTWKSTSPNPVRDAEHQSVHVQRVNRDANNQFWDNTLTYYSMNNGYWIASVNGLPDTYLAFQATPLKAGSPYFKVLNHTPNTNGYVAWDEATRGNVQ